MAEITDITPADDTVFVGSDFVVKVMLTDDDDVAVTSASAALSLSIKPPSGSAVTKTGGDLTEEGAGVYSFAYRTTTPGLHYATWTYDNGARKRVSQSRFNVTVVR